MSLMSSDDVTGYYGTNVHELSVEPIGMMTDGSEYKEASVNVENAQNQDALLFEIPYTGSGTPEAGEITLINADGAVINTTLDDGNGNGNTAASKYNYGKGD